MTKDAQEMAASGSNSAAALSPAGIAFRGSEASPAPASGPDRAAPTTPWRHSAPEALETMTSAHTLQTMVCYPFAYFDLLNALFLDGNS